MNIEPTVKQTQPLSPYLLLLLGGAVGAATMLVLFAKTPLFSAISFQAKQATEQEQQTQNTAQNSPSETVSVTPTPTDEELLRVATQIASGIPTEDFEFSLGVISGLLAKGSLKNKNDMSGAAWFAAKINGTWKIAYIGQGVPKCSEVEQYNFPTSWLSHCIDVNGTTRAL